MHDELYQLAYKDIEEKEIDEALWLKAMSHASGDKTKAKWTYIELRVDQLLRDPLSGTAPERRSASQIINQEPI